MFKNLSGTVRTLLFIGIAAIVVLAAVLIGSLALRVDVAQARETALAAAGGGEVISQEIDQEGLWNEYSFDIMTAICGERGRNQRLRKRDRPGEQPKRIR